MLASRVKDGELVLPQTKLETSPKFTPPATKARNAWRRSLAFASFILFFHAIVRMCSRSFSGYDDDIVALTNSWEYKAYVAAPSKQGSKCAERTFLTVPDETSALNTSRVYTSKPHIAGSHQDLVTAVDVLNVFQREFGLEQSDLPPIYAAGSKESREATLSVPSLTAPKAWIDTYYPVMNLPLERSLEILEDDGSVAWKAELEEVADDTDPEAGKYADAIGTWHGLSSAGDVSGKLLFVNYGTQTDFEKLANAGVNITGTIVIARYGAVFRGLKVQAAQEHGAVGILIYVDPRDSGSVTVSNGYKPYPHGPALNPTSVQRGSVQFISKYPGDPTTPGYPSYPNSTRTEAMNIPRIPSLPISWANAERLLEEISNVEEGGLSERTIRLMNNVDTKVTPIWNTMAVIPGHVKNEVVLVGNHRDAWVLGAVDPTSGTVSMNEVFRGLGLIYSKGWRPLRTIMFASWDAEEYGLIGSTEWAEDFKPWIAENIAVYLNLDSSVGGSRFQAGASPSLAHFLRKAAMDIPHPTDKKRTLWDATKDEGPFTGPSDPGVKAMYEEKLKALGETNVVALGSGSDFTPFLQHIGIASMDASFGPTLTDAVYHYHSVYDSHRWQEVYGDPGFHRHVAVAKHLGLMTLRMANSYILHLNTTQYSLELDAYLDRVEEIANTMSFKLDFSSLRDAIGGLQKASLKLDKEKVAAAKRLHKLVKKLQKRHGTGWRAKLRSFKRAILIGLGLAEPRPDIIKKLIEAAKHVQKVNKKLSSFERGFISEGGIRDREWYKHLGVAPGKWLGYGATTFPALTESFTIDKNLTLAEYEMKRLTELITKLTKSLSV